MDASLSIGLSALLTAQRNLDVTGHNIANQATPNYSRQRVNQASVSPSRLASGQSGSGVRVVSIEAVRDSLIDSSLLGTDPTAGGADRKAQVLGEIESLFSTDSQASLGSTIAGLFNSFRDLSNNPGGTAERIAVVQNAQAVADGFNSIGEALQGYQQQLVPQIQDAVAQVNKLSGDIASLNARIRDTVIQNGDPNDLVDQRFTLLRQLAAYVPIDVTNTTLGRVDVRSGGQLLVTGEHSLTLTTQTQGTNTQIFVGGSTTAFKPATGQLGALFDIAENVLPAYRQQLDTLAATLAREINRVQSTGVGASGSFTTLQGQVTVANANLPLSQCALPFPLEAGTLTVSVIRQDTGEVAQGQIAFDPAVDTLTSLAAKLTAVPGLRASVAGRALSVSADAGYAFDFTNKVPTHPGSLGTAAVTLGGAAELDANDTYTFAVDASRATTVSSISGDATLADLSGGAEGFRLRVALPDGTFATSADLSLNQDYSTGHTLDDLAADLNAAIAADPAVAGKVEAYTDGTQIGFRASATGSASSVQLLDPTAGTTAVGAGHLLSGFTAGQSDSEALTVGSTAGLRVAVRNAAGATVATLDVGDGYTAGQAISLDGGITVCFGAGTVTGTPADSLSVALAADADPQGLLAALGVNTLFRGSTATGLGVEPGVVADPSRIAAASSDAASDNTNALRLAAVQEQAFAGLGGTTIDDACSQLIGQVGLDSQTASNTRDSSKLMLEAAENQRDAISGVSQDEEAVNLLRFQQAYQYAARYLKVIEDITDLLTQL